MDICLRMHGSLVINDLLDERLASGFLLEAGVALGAVHFDFSLAAFEAHQALAARAAEILVFPAHFQTEQEGLEIETGFPGPCGILAVFLSTLGAVPTVHGTNQIRMDPPYFHMATDYPLSLSTRGCILRSNTSRFDGILRIIALVKAFIESFLNDIVL